MRLRLTCILALAAFAPAHGQEIVKVPASSAPNVSRPDDLFTLPPDQWHFAAELWQSDAPCTVDQCEGGYTSGDLVVSVERSKKFVRILAGVRGCEANAYSELETGIKPGKSTRKKLAKQVDTVVKGLGKSCKLTLPKVAALDSALLFPPDPEKAATTAPPAPPSAPAAADPPAPPPPTENQ